MNNYSIFLFTLFSLFWRQATAQNYTLHVQQFGLEEGLVHRNITALCKQKSALLWLGLNDALQRYDGHDFKSFQLDKSLEHISQIHELKDGSLLLSNTFDYQQILFLDPISGKTIKNTEKWGEIRGNQYDTLIQQSESFFSKKEALYAIHSKGITRVDWETGTQELVLDRNILPNSTELKIQFIDYQNNIWLLADNEFVVINPEDKSILNRFKAPVPRGRFAREILSEWKSEIYATHLIGRGGTGQEQVYHLSKSGERKLLFEVPLGFRIHQFTDGKIWCIGEIGWQVFDLSGKLLFELRKEEHDKKLFEGITFSKFIKGDLGKFYFATEFGLNIIEVKENPFISYFSNKAKRPLPIANAARSIYANKDSLLVAFEFGGLVTFPTNEAENYSILLSEIPHPETKKRQNFDGRIILRDEKQHFWTDIGGYLLKWKPDLLSYETNFFSENRQQIWSLFEDENNCIWAAHFEGLRKICDGHSTYFDYIETGFGRKELHIYQIQADGDGLLWLCSSEGIYVFNPTKSEIIEQYHENAKGEHYLPASDFFMMHTDSEGNKWFGTRSGLLFWNTQTYEKRLFTRSDGLSNNVIYAVYEDDYQKLWLSSDYGIMSFHKETFDVQTYLPKDGAQEEYNRVSHFQAADGRIYFGGLNGVTAFHPKDFVKRQEEHTHLLISDFEIFDGRTEQLLNKLEEVSSTKSISFHPKDRFFRLKFTLPTFEETSRILYAWKVEGVDTDWNYQKENSIQIGMLPYGTHTLRVKGQSSGGWSPHELAIQVHVLKPTYLQTWFIALSIVGLIAGVFFFYRRRTRLLRKRQKRLEVAIKNATTQIASDKRTIEVQAEELRQLDKLKSRFFANVSHELRTPLTLMLAPINSALKSERLDNRNFKLLKKAEQGGKDLLKLVASILDLSKMEAGKLELREKPEVLFQLCRRIASAFESHAQREEIALAFQYEAEADLQLELDKDKLEIILNNLLSNAIKFTSQNGKVSFKVQDLRNSIKISVADTGRGIHPDDLPHIFNRFYQSKQQDAPTEGGTGIGLALSQELVQLMQGKIWVESEWDKGSTFFVELPRKEILGTVFYEAPVLEETEAEVIILAETPSNVNTSTTILVVEDNHSLRDYLASILSPYYQVKTAENGLAALDILTNAHAENALPQLVVSDIMMPMMDGFQLLQVIKSRDYLSHLPVIMLTARADVEDKLKALRIGVDDYLLKPFVEEELLARIENLLQNYQERLAYIAERTESKQSEAEAASTPTMSKEDQVWLKELETHLQEHISNNKYSITQLAFDLAISERQLRRRIKQLVGLSPTQYFKAIRLQRARQLLEQKNFKTVAQVGAAVGFRDAGAFSRSFLNHFGKTPLEYLNN